MTSVGERRSLAAWLDARRVLVGDGAMGTELQAAGLAGGECPELWNVERPDAVEAVMRSYVEAGADLIETNTFGGSPRRLAAFGLGERCVELCRAAAELGRRAARDEALVVGSIGPVGEMLQPYGPVEPQEAADGFMRQACALAEGGADVLCVETMGDLQESLLAVRAAVATGLEVIATMTFSANPRGFFTLMGVDVARAAVQLADAGATVLGANCSLGPAEMTEVMRAFGDHTRLPLLAQPNAGTPDVVQGQVRYPETPASMASFVPALVAAGTRIVGGCCGTTPSHVRATAAAVSAVR